MFARELADLTPRGLSVLAGLDPTHVRLIEGGDRPDPRSSTVLAIAQTLGVTVEWLLTGEGDAPTADHVRAVVERARTEARLALTGTENR